MLLRSNQLLPGHRYCRQSWGDPPQNQFHIWDQGHRGTGSGTSLPTGRCRGIFDMAQTKLLRTYRMTSRVILGHQNRTWRSERVCVLPGCPEPGILCTESQKALTLWCRDIGFPSGPPAELVRWGWRHWCSQRCSTGWDWRWGLEGWWVLVTSEILGSTGGIRHLPLQLQFPGR